MAMEAAYMERNRRAYNIYEAGNRGQRLARDELDADVAHSCAQLGDVSGQVFLGAALNKLTGTVMHRLSA